MKNLKAQTTILAIIFIAVVSAATGYFYLQNRDLKSQLGSGNWAVNTSIPPKPITNPSVSLNPTDASREPNGSAETANWKTYTNTAGYSIKYPLSFTTQLLAAGSGEKEAGTTARQLFVYQIGSKEPYLERYVNFESFTSNPASTISTATQTNINGFPAQKISSPNAPFDVYTMMTPNKEFVEIYVSNDPSRKNLANQILSTFKLLESPAGETEGSFCGGFAGKLCPDGFECRMEGDYPDASGTCIKK